MQDPERDWPPRSPQQALLSSPGGRRRHEERRLRRLSPSPLKQLKRTPSKRAAPPLPTAAMSDEEDEETLQLQLKAIEAKLKLKKLQSKKSIYRSEPNSENEDPAQSVESRAQSILSSRHDGALKRAKSSADVHVPVSPVKNPPQEVLQRSPGRVMLGIDKGLSARHVSLKRAPSQKDSNSDPFVDKPSSRPAALNGRSKPTTSGTRSNVKSFSERMTESRERETKEKASQARLNQLRNERSKGFGISQKELEAFETVVEAESTTSTEKRERIYTREDVLNGMDKESKPLQKSNLVGHRSRTAASASSQAGTGQARSTSVVRRKGAQDGHSEDKDTTADTGDSGLLEPYSSSNLSKRVLPHSFIRRTMDNKAPKRVPDLLREIKGPKYEIPEEMLSQDFVVFAIVASKSDPLAHKQAVRMETKAELLTSAEEADRSERNEHGLYLILTLTDLTWTIDLFLFGTAFTQYRKLTQGTVIALLNPEVMPPPRNRADTGKFSLKISSSEDTLLEIGTAKDVGWCSATKKDGQPCGAWIDKRTTSVCEFHSMLGVERTRSGRMEVQGMSTPFGPGGRQGSRGRGSGGWASWGSQGQGRGRGRGRGRGEQNERGPRFDREAQSVYYQAPAFGINGPSAATLLDAEDFNYRIPSKERQRLELAEAEKERRMAEGLGLRGNGAGAEYLRHHGKPGTTTLAGEETAVSMENVNKRSAASLGLTGGAARGVMLSPLKRKHSGGAEASVKKKTRFITPKGIREAGRDSLGKESLLALGSGGHDDDDELDIV